MNIKYISSLVFLCVSYFVYGQNSMEQVLADVEANNLMLKSVKHQKNALQTLNNTGLNPDNPEVRMAYLWGDPDQVGNRTDFSISQSLDFPTSYHYRNQKANALNKGLDFRYQQAYNVVMCEAKLVCHQLIYLNLQKQEQVKRLDFAQQIAEAYRYKFTEGSVNILELNKADLNLLNAKTSLSKINTELNVALQKLQVLNGGEVVSFDGVFFDEVFLPDDFELWYATQASSIPLLSEMTSDLEASRFNEKLAKSLTLPKLSVGYMTETVVGQQYSGVTAGITIPLWENKNTVKQIKRSSLVSETELRNKSLETYHELKAIYQNAVQLQGVVLEYKQAMAVLSNVSMLSLALEVGEISILEYIVELGFYYDTIDKMYLAERELHDTVARMKAFVW